MDDKAKLGEQFWLAEMDQHGNPKLIDGPHSHPEGLKRALYLIQFLHLGNPNRRFALARVFLSASEPSDEGVNKEAVATLTAAPESADAPDEWPNFARGQAKQSERPEPAPQPALTLGEYSGHPLQAQQPAEGDGGIQRYATVNDHIVKHSTGIFVLYADHVAAMQAQREADLGPVSEQEWKTYYGHGGEGRAIPTGATMTHDAPDYEALYRAALIREGDLLDRLGATVAGPKPCPNCGRTDGWHKAEGHPPPPVGDCRKIVWLETPDRMAYWGVRAYTSDGEDTGWMINGRMDTTDVVTHWMEGPHNPAYPPSPTPQPAEPRLSPYSDISDEQKSKEQEKRKEIQRWRDDAFEASAVIAERYGCKYVAADIRALIRAALNPPTKEAANGTQNSNHR